MNKYFGFFLCAYGWTRAEAAADVIRESINLVQPREALTISGRRPSEINALKGSIGGDYSNYAEQLSELSQSSFIIANTRFPRAGTELNICFEGVSGDYDYAVKSYSQSKDSVLAFTPRTDALVTLTISIRADIWQKIQRRGNAAKLVKAVEDGFVSLGATYGYGHPVPMPLPGRFSLIWGNSMPGYPRVVDFNYRKHIERVCELNLISNVQMRGRDFEEHLKVIDGVEIRRLCSPDKKVIQGIAIQIKDYQKAHIPVQEALEGLVWPPDEHGLVPPIDTRTL